MASLWNRPWLSLVGVKQLTPAGFLGELIGVPWSEDLHPEYVAPMQPVIDAMHNAPEILSGVFPVKVPNNTYTFVAEGWYFFCVHDIKPFRKRLGAKLHHYIATQNDAVGEAIEELIR